MQEPHLKYAPLDGCLFMGLLFHDNIHRRRHTHTHNAYCDAWNQFQWILTRIFRLQNTSVPLHHCCTYTAFVVILNKCKLLSFVDICQFWNFTDVLVLLSVCESKYSMPAHGGISFQQTITPTTTKTYQIATTRKIQHNNESSFWMNLIGVDPLMAFAKTTRYYCNLYLSSSCHFIHAEWVTVSVSSSKCMHKSFTEFVLHFIWADSPWLEFL